MKKKLSFTFFVLLLALFQLTFAITSDKPAYNLFNKNGSPVQYNEMLDKLKKADVVFFGELHDNPISHWLQLEVTKDLYITKNENLLLGAEMFEADNQLILDEYLNGLISEKKFESEARLWPNYKTDYKPLLTFAKVNNLDFIAANIPRRYASVVFKHGFEGLNNLTKQAKKHIAPLPIEYNPELSCYKKMLKMGNGRMGMMKANPNFPKAQAIKDVTMAHFIAENWENGDLFLHFNGSYHSDNFQGIVWYLKQSNEDLNIVTITTVLQNDIAELKENNREKADFIICVPISMTRTH